MVLIAFTEQFIIYLKVCLDI